MSSWSVGELAMRADMSTESSALLPAPLQ